jgi:hypothetical protein
MSTRRSRGARPSRTPRVSARRLRASIASLGSESAFRPDVPEGDLACMMIPPPCTSDFAGFRAFVILRDGFPGEAVAA